MVFKMAARSQNNLVLDDVSANDLTFHAGLGKIFGLDSKGHGRGIVNVGQARSKNMNFAVKRYFIDDASEEALKLVRYEVVLMKQLRHENILPCLASFASPNNMEIWLISPLMEMGSMRRILDSFYPEGIPEVSSVSIIRDILFGLNHLHERGIVHRALKVNMIFRL